MYFWHYRMLFNLRSECRADFSGSLVSLFPGPTWEIKEPTPVIGNCWTEMPILPPEEVINAKNLRLWVKPQKRRETHVCGAINNPLVAHPERTDLQEVEQPTKKVNPRFLILWLGLCWNNYPPWLNKEFPRTLYIKVNVMMTDVTLWGQGQASLPQNSWPLGIQCCPC